MIGLRKIELLVVTIMRIYVDGGTPKVERRRGKLKYKNRIEMFCFDNQISYVFFSSIDTCPWKFNLKITRVVHVLMRSMEHTMCHVNARCLSCVCQKGVV